MIKEIIIGISLIVIFYSLRRFYFELKLIKTYERTKALKERWKSGEFDDEKYFKYLTVCQAVAQEALKDNKNIRGITFPRKAVRVEAWERINLLIEKMIRDFKEERE